MARKLGTYIDTLQNIAVDSMALNLTIHNSATGDTITAACDNFVWQGTAYTASGMYYDTMQTTAGCDGVDADLTINSYTAPIDTLTACDSLVWQGTTYMASGMYYDTLQTTAGCDSVLTLDLTINNSYAAPVDVQTACDSLVWQVQRIWQVCTMTVTDYSWL